MNTPFGHRVVSGFPPRLVPRLRLCAYCRAEDTEPCQRLPNGLFACRLHYGDGKLVRTRPMKSIRRAERREKMRARKGRRLAA